MDNNLGSGLITKIWGPHMWVSLHSTAYDYPLKPTPKDKIKFKQFFELVGDILPCYHCRDSYKDFISCGITKLDDNVMENRESLTKWLYYIHEAVNKKLGVDYGVSYDDVTKRYESYKSSCNSKNVIVTEKGCDAPLDRKTISFRIENTKDCPIIPLKMAKHFIKYAKMRGLSEQEFTIINSLKDNCKQDKELWNKRNNECSDIIKTMKLQGKKPVENEGEFKDLPTIDEVKLILRLSSNISLEKLTEIIKKLPNCNCEYQKTYRLSS